MSGAAVIGGLAPVAALYTTATSVYRGLVRECYDIHRDSRTYRGWLPVVAHPPCRGWGRLRHFAKIRADELDLAVHAVHQVRRCGGVLEHPAGSLLWSHVEKLGRYQLPGVGSLVPDAFGGVSFSVYQGDFGHPAPKHTWLYFVPAGESCKDFVRPGELCKDFVRPGELCKDFVRPGELCKDFQPGELRKDLRTVASQPTARRMDTPEPFAKFLISIAVWGLD